MLHLQTIISENQNTKMVFAPCLPEDTAEECSSEAAMFCKKQREAGRGRPDRHQAFAHYTSGSSFLVSQFKLSDGKGATISYQAICETQLLHEPHASTTIEKHMTNVTNYHVPVHSIEPRPV